MTMPGHGDMVGMEKSSYFRVQSRDLAIVTFKEYRAHVHVGPCEPRWTGTTVGGHYNVAPSEPSPVSARKPRFARISV